MKIIREKWNILKYLMLMIGSIFTIIGVTGTSFIDVLPSKWLFSCSLDIFSMLVCCLFMYSNIKDTFKAGDSQIYFHFCALTVILMFFFDELTWLVDGNDYCLMVNHIANFFCYFFPYLLLYFFWLFMASMLEGKIDKGILYKLMIFSVIIAEILLILNLKFHFYYSIGTDGVYNREEFFEFRNAVPVFYFVTLYHYIISATGDHSMKMRIIHYTVLPLFASVLQNIMYGLSFFSIAILAVMILIYINIFLQRSTQLVQYENEMIKKEKEMSEYQTQVMITQIQPHFLYNTLASISMLYDIDPEKAADATRKFSKYLRMNLDNIDNSHPILFSKEMEHVKTYLYFEKMRFDDITIKIDHIENENFVVPALSIQPIVENAVKHGLMSREEGGVLTIAEYEREDCHEIVVIDDGIGFYETQKDDGREHVGLRNITKRIENMVNGTITIDSEKNKGTKVTVRIPK